MECLWKSPGFHDVNFLKAWPSTKVAEEPDNGVHFIHCYATVAIVHQDQRYELGVTFVWADDSMAQVVERLVQRVRSLKLRIW